MYLFKMVGIIEKAKQSKTLFEAIDFVMRKIPQGIFLFWHSYPSIFDDSLFCLIKFCDFMKLKDVASASFLFINR